MERQSFAQEKTKKLWISTTGYRILIILKALLEKSCTIEELVEILKNNPVVNKSISKDTIRLAINTLKSAGCIIDRPTKKNNYKYELIKHPFTFNLSEKELELFLQLREKYARETSWQEVLLINDLYDEIAALTCNEEIKTKVHESRPLAEINTQLLWEFWNSKLIGKKVQIRYISPEYGEEDIDIIPHRITYENGKIYLGCHSFKYNRNSLLNFERILKINVINLKETYTSAATYEVMYEITGDSISTFELKDNEKLVYLSNEVIRVNAVVENEFLFVQRILLFGCNVKIISPDFFRRKLINKLKLIQKGYEE